MEILQQVGVLVSIDKRQLEVISMAQAGRADGKAVLRITYCSMGMAWDLDVRAMDFTSRGSSEHTSTFPTDTGKFLIPQEVSWDWSNQIGR